MDNVVTSQFVRGGSRDRVRGIDGLRAISLILVLQAHWAPSEAFQEIAEWGRAGLLVFFVISGFLITRILIDLSARRQIFGARALLVNFYCRRFFRIQPIYYLGLAFIICMSLNDAVREDVLYHVLFLQNFSNVFLREDLGTYGPAYPWWSLAVEEQFYLFWAPAVIFLRPRAWKAVLVGSIALAIGWRAFAWFADLGQANVLVTLGNLDALGAGAAVAIITSSDRGPVAASRWFSVVMVSGIVGFCILAWAEYNFGLVAFRSSFLGKVVCDVPVYLVAASLIFFLASGRADIAAKVLDNPVLTYLGRRSYGAYVYHLVVSYTFLYYVTPRYIEPLLGIKLGLYGPVEFCVFAPITIAIAALSYRYIEKPIFRLRDRAVPTL
ncbi:acyltransferase family protein [Rhizobium hidalgonense]|uniref:acyltransferase family protein n=1 Tax=Rhizobium hidalgonense TaxID=1538159 RepID=UPI00110715F5|nr:acyltransferase [Rhizobium hidalgonense]QKK24646.1 acyltransferase [Rhizobium hidalgonense]